MSAKATLCANIWPVFDFDRVIFDNYGAQKSLFLDFFKVVLDLFKKCLGFVFGLKGPTLGCILSFKGL